MFPIETSCVIFCSPFSAEGGKQLHCIRRQTGASYLLICVDIGGETWLRDILISAHERWNKHCQKTSGSNTEIISKNSISRTPIDHLRGIAIIT